MADDGGLFPMFRLLVEDARDTRGARRSLSTVFMSLNLAGLGAVGYLVDKAQSLNPVDATRPPIGADAAPPLNLVLLGGVIVALILTCVIWHVSNVYYRRILKAKYEVIHDYEVRMGENPIEAEWKKLGGSKALRAFTLERAMPLAFIFGYVAFYLMQFPQANTILHNLVQALQ
jgi:hypothetical protein